MVNGIKSGIAGLSLLAMLALPSGGTGEAAETAPTKASQAFWKAWGDGKAELSGYKVTTSRYGAPRSGRLVLIYVTEPMDRRVWVKDDAGDIPAADRVNVMKLNQALTFRTGIYPYSVMTSTFAPVDGGSPERFTPVKVVLSAQEWCGSVFHKLIAKPGAFQSDLHSYFHKEGDKLSDVTIPAGSLYEDALWIQLRELDGRFAGGKDWSGTIVPSLWSSRKAHTPLAAVNGSIKRSESTRDGSPVTRFVVTIGSVTKTIDVEKAHPHRILGWTTSDGESASILKTARLPYWQLHDPGGEKYLEQLGL
jgi:hypothetical protein